jgi:hypothetical protein
MSLADIGAGSNTERDEILFYKTNKKIIIIHMYMYAYSSTCPKSKREVIEVLNHTRFERITFRSGVERATVAPAVLAVDIMLLLILINKRKKLSRLRYLTLR